MARKIARRYGTSEQLRSSMRGRDSDVVFFADIYREGGVPQLGSRKECASVSAPTLAGGFFLCGVASNTSAAAIGIAEAIDAWNSVSLVGSRPTHACKQSNRRARDRGYRTLRSRSRADHMDRP